jgi:FtsZ-binding cell division protein ZapB
MKYILSAAILLLSFNSYSQLQVNVNWLQPPKMQTKDTVYYNPSYQLVWPDFKGVPDQNNTFALAITSSGFGFTAGYQMRNGKASLNINVFCYFSKHSSWVKEGKESDYALNHEQHHFDVSYIATCRFIEKLKAAKFTVANYDDLLTKIYNESTTEMESLQNDYDGQTKNGRLKDVQEQWNKKINTMLGKGPGVVKD